MSGLKSDCDYEYTKSTTSFGKIDFLSKNRKSTSFNALNNLNILNSSYQNSNDDIIAEKIKIKKIIKIQTAYRFYIRNKKILKENDNLMVIKHNSNVNVYLPSVDNDCN